MTIQISCPTCSKNFRVKTELAGKRVRCQCGSPIRIPEVASDVLDAHENSPSRKHVPSANPNTDALPRLPKSRTTQKRVNSKKTEGSFRSVDVIFIVVGVIVALSGFGAVFGFLAAVSSLSSISMTGPQLEALPKTFRAEMLVASMSWILMSLTQIALGVCGGGVAYYVYEKRTSGKSDFGWSFQAGAFAGVACIVVSIVCQLFSFFMVIQRFDDIAMFSFSAFASIAGLGLGALLPIAMIVAYTERERLKYEELL